VIKDLERSGLPVTQFAAKHGLAIERLYRWKKRLSRAPARSTPPRFAEVTLRPPALQPAAIEIELRGGVSIRFVGQSRVDDAIAILTRLPVR
jgi:hypothetical protein